MDTVGSVEPGASPQAAGADERPRRAHTPAIAPARMDPTTRDPLLAALKSLGAAVCLTRTAGQDSQSRMPSGQGGFAGQPWASVTRDTIADRGFYIPSGARPFRCQAQACRTDIDTRHVRETRRLSSLVSCRPAGRRLFETNCVLCHGPAGKGDGPVGAALTPQPRDLTFFGVNQDAEVPRAGCPVVVVRVRSFEGAVRSRRAEPGRPYA
jgi:hypothetical protein